MTPIDSSGNLAALIRRQVSSLARAPSSAASSGSRSPARDVAALARLRTPAPADVASTIARRVQSIARDDPKRHRKAFRVFLESVLLSELGSELINDAGFHQLVENAHAQMDADAELAQAIHQAASQMLESVHTPRGS